MARTDPKDVIAKLAGEGIEFFTPEDLRVRLGLTRNQADGLAHRLLAANLVRRVRRGLYVITGPLDWQGGQAVGINWYWAAANAVGGEPYYLAYYTAMELHQMLQHPLRTVLVAVVKHHRDFTFGPAGIRFVKLIANKLFGEENRRLDGHVIKVAQLERTFIDCADRLDLCGGIEEVVQGFARRHRDLDPDRLLRFVQRFDKPVVAKRLGYLLELVGHGDRELLWDLERAGGRLRRYFPLDKTRPTVDGTRDRRWELIVNVDAHRLLRGART